MSSSTSPAHDVPASLGSAAGERECGIHTDSKPQVIVVGGPEARLDEALPKLREVIAEHGMQDRYRILHCATPLEFQHDLSSDNVPEAMLSGNPLIDNEIRYMLVEAERAEQLGDQRLLDMVIGLPSASSMALPEDYLVMAAGNDLLRPDLVEIRMPPALSDENLDVAWRAEDKPPRNAATSLRLPKPNRYAQPHQGNREITRRARRLARLATTNSK